VEVLTPDAHFASINEDGELKISIIIEKGMGYVSSEELMPYTPEGYLALDAIFGSVKKANYTIERMLVEDNPNYEKIIFEVVSYGQVDPVFVFEQGVSTMFRQLDVFSQQFGVKSTKVSSVKVKDSEDVLKQYLVKIEDLNLSARSHHCLDYSKIKYLGEILLMGENEIAKIKNLGKKSLDEIKEKLEEIGYPIQNGIVEPIASKLREKIEELKG
jgi:DNA-directed RNA polymerase subunit alpha